MCKVNEISFYCPHSLALIFPRYTTAIAKLFFHEEVAKVIKGCQNQRGQGVMPPQILKV